MSHKVLKIALFGIQGAGKGTQGKRIVDTYGIPSISPGTMFRKEVKDQTELGAYVRPYVERGALVPDDVTNAMMRERLLQDDCRNGYILDGYPRDKGQMIFLDAQDALTHVLNIRLSDALAVERIAGRRACSLCGAKYNVKASPSKKSEVCDVCEGPLETRSDDQPEAVRERLRIYHAETEPLLRFYEDKGILHELNGDRGVDEVWQEIQSLLK